MATSHGADRGFIEGASLSVKELHSDYGIPHPEISSFQKYIFIYSDGAPIIEEGDLDQSLYLLRMGEVGVYKQVGSDLELIDTIKAVNFFGEMSLVNAGPRSASIIAQGVFTVVYKIEQPNLSIILQNTKWAEMLFSRLCKNLANSNDNLVAATKLAGELRSTLHTKEEEIVRQTVEYEKTIRNMQLAINAILYFQSKVKDQAIVGSKGWAYLNALMDMTRKMIEYYLPNLAVSEKFAEISAVRDNLKLIRRDDQESVFNELDGLI